MSWPRCGLLTAVLLTHPGCHLTSKWAMDYPEYAEKYDAPYPDDHWEKWKRMGKQVVDARFIGEETGWYASLGGGFHDDDAAVLASVGCLTFPTSWSETRIGVGGAAATGVLLGGVEGGLRLHMPTRLAPFIGIGGYGGANGSDDDDSPWGERDVKGIGAFYPELGVHFWINGSTRASLRVYPKTWFDVFPRDHAVCK